MKYGYCQLRVEPNDAYNFVYVLPQFPPYENKDETDILITISIQMVSIESPACFYSASETVRDISDERA